MTATKPHEPKHAIVDIGHDPITRERAAAELGDPRAFVAIGDATHKVTLISRPNAGARKEQKTYYFNQL